MKIHRMLISFVNYISRSVRINTVVQKLLACLIGMAIYDVPPVSHSYLHDEMNMVSLALMAMLTMVVSASI